MPGRISIPFLTSRASLVNNDTTHEPVHRSSIISASGGPKSDRAMARRTTLPPRKILLGICCMNTKSQGNPMKALIRRLEASGIFDINIFGDDVILNKPIEEWPKVECLIGFYSNGFPLEKAIDYVRLVKPIEVNRLDKQPLLRNRLLMYETLRAYEIPCPDFMFIDHDRMVNHSLEETDD